MPLLYIDIGPISADTILDFNHINLIKISAEIIE